MPDYQVKHAGRPSILSAKMNTEIISAAKAAGLGEEDRGYLRSSSWRIMELMFIIEV